MFDFGAHAPRALLNMVVCALSTGCEVLGSQCLSNLVPMARSCRVYNMPLGEMSRPLAVAAISAKMIENLCTSTEPLKIWVLLLVGTAGGLPPLHALL